MAERKVKPTWVSGYHPADQNKNLEALAAMVEVLLPDYPVLTTDLSAAVSVVALAEQAFTVACSSAARGTLTYQWQKKTTGSYSNISSATSATYTVASWATENEGTYRCVITNTFNNTTAITYSGECVAATAE